MLLPGGYPRSPEWSVIGLYRISGQTQPMNIYLWRAGTQNDHCLPFSMNTGRSENQRNEGIEIYMLDGPGLFAYFPSTESPIGHGTYIIW